MEKGSGRRFIRYGKRGSVSAALLVLIAALALGGSLMLRAADSCPF